MSAQTARSLLYLGSWSPLDLIKDKDIIAVTKLPELDDEGSDYEMEEGWDQI